MLARRQRRDRQRRVLFVGRGDHHGIHRRIVEHLLRRGTHVHVAERAQQRVALRTDDAVQHQPGVCWISGAWKTRPARP
jgi:NAD(P)-dependent dehydrogenase (short-subunit alcohol dehydrogenase family)